MENPVTNHIYPALVRVILLILALAALLVAAGAPVCFSC